MTIGMFAAVSGIRVNQSRLNVISNNLANLNTVAFKGSQMNFQTAFAQTLTSGSGPSSSTGGVNPMQIGTGASISEITQNHTQGGTINTGRATDLAINGNGFFTVERGSNSGGAANNYLLTRAGNFSLDGSGNLVTAGGARVLGTATVDGDNPATVGTINTPLNLRIFKEYDSSNNLVDTYIAQPLTSAPSPGAGNSISVQDVSLVNYAFGRDGAVSATYSNGDRITVRTNPGSTNTREVIHFASEGRSFAGNVTGVDGALTIMGSSVVAQQLQLRMATVQNPSGLLAQASNNFDVGPNSGTLSLGIGNGNGRGEVIGGALESSNIDIAQEFTNMVVSQRGLEAASRAINIQSEVMRAVINIQ